MKFSGVIHAMHTKDNQETCPVQYKESLASERRDSKLVFLKNEYSDLLQTCSYSSTTSWFQQMQDNEEYTIIDNIYELLSSFLEKHSVFLI